MSYQYAKVTKPREHVDSALITDDDGQGGVYLYLMLSYSGKVFPGSRGWCPSEAEAKKQCLETLDIPEADWQTEDGEPEWAQAFRDATADAIKRYQKSVGEKSG